MKKFAVKVLSLLLAFILAAGMLPLTALAQEPVCDCGTETGMHTEECPLYEAPQQPEATPTEGGASGQQEATPTEGGASQQPEAPQPVRVTFELTPAAAAVTVYGVDGGVTAPEQDGSYSLLPGEYAYTAECEGFITLEYVPFTVAEGKEAALSVVLDTALSLGAASDGAFLALLNNIDLSEADLERLAGYLQYINSDEAYAGALRYLLNYLYENYDPQLIAELESLVSQRGEEILQNYREAFEERRRGDGDYAVNNVIVEFYGDEHLAAVEDSLEGADFEAGERIGEYLGLNYMTVELPLEFSVEKACQVLEALPFVKSAQPDYILTMAEETESFTLPNDHYIEQQWHMEAINVYDAWQLMPEDAGKVKVAVVDTLVDHRHPDLQAAYNRELSWDFTGSINSKAVDVDVGEAIAADSEFSDHGTHVAGIIAATAYNEIGVAGVASGPENDWIDLIAVGASHNRSLLTGDIMQAIDYAVSQNARVVNMSLGGPGYNASLESIINEAVDEGVVFVCAAGNDDTSEYCSPSDFESVISVIALNDTLARASYSNYGEAKDISAPGSSIASTVLSSEYANMSGTSMASPVVAAVAAMLISADADMTPYEVKSILERTAVDLSTEGFDVYTGWGCVDAEAAVRAALGNDSVASGYCGAEGDGSALRWSLSVMGELAVSGSGPMADYEATLDADAGKYVTNAPWAEYAERLSSLRFDEGVTALGANAFRGCSGLAGTLTLPRSLASVGAAAFMDCGFTGSVAIPAALATIGARAFDSAGITSFSADSENTAFSSAGGGLYNKAGTVLLRWPMGGGNCVLPDSVTTIGEGAFSGCTGLTGTFELPPALSALGRYAFENTGFEAVSISSRNRYFTGKDGMLFDKRGATLVLCPAGRTGEAAIPSNVTAIGVGAFSGCDGLTGRLTLPAGLKSIGSDAFKGCSGFSGNLIIPSKVTSIGDEAFVGCAGLDGAVVIPASVLSIGRAAFLECDNVGGFCFLGAPPTAYGTIKAGPSFPVDKTMRFSSGWVGQRWLGYSTALLGAMGFCGSSRDSSDLVWSLCVDSESSTLIIEGAGAMAGYSGAGDDPAASTAPWYAWRNEILSISLADGITDIGARAFSGCAEIAGPLKLPESLVSVGDCAFYGCEGLTGRLDLPAGVVYIGERAFMDCVGMNGTLAIPEATVSIGERAFARGGFSAIEVSSANEKYSSADGILYNKTKTELVQCLAGKAGAMSIPASVTSIGNMAFSGCGLLTGDLALPSAVSTVGAYAFENCTGFSGTLMLPDSLTFIGEGAFSGCTGLTGDISLPAGLTSIEKETFSGCSGFAGSFAVPVGVSQIGEGAFSGCVGLSGRLILPAAVAFIGPRAFAGCEGITEFKFLGNAPEATAAGTAQASFPFAAAVQFNKGTAGWDAPLWKGYASEMLEWASFGIEDGWPVPNGAEGFGYVAGYSIPSARYTEAYGFGSRFIDTEDIFGQWNGSSFGMALSAALRSMEMPAGRLSASGFRRAEGDHYTLDGDSAGVSAMESFQISRYSTRLRDSLISDGAPFKIALERLSQYPLVACLYYDGQGAALTLCSDKTPESTQYAGNDVFTVEVYDPDHPYDGAGKLTAPDVSYQSSEGRKLYLGKTDGAWYYERADGTVWSGTASDIEIYDVSALTSASCVSGLELAEGIYFRSAGGMSLTAGGESVDDITSFAGYRPFVDGAEGVSGTLGYDGGDVTVNSAGAAEVMLVSGGTIIILKADRAAGFTASTDTGTVSVTADGGTGYSITIAYGGARSCSARFSGRTADGGTDTFSLNGTGILRADVSTGAAVETELDGSLEGGAAAIAADDLWLVSGGDLLEARDAQLPELSQEYVILKAGEDHSLELRERDGSEFTGAVRWSSTADSVATVEDGVLQAEAPGYAWAVASFFRGGRIQTLRCRVDVIEAGAPAGENDLENALTPSGTVHLQATSATASVYSVNNAKVGILFDLQQNSQTFSVQSVGEIVNNGAMVEEARFAPPARAKDPDINEFFALRVLDDATLELVPLVDTNDAAAVAKLRSSYKGSVIVTADGIDYTAPEAFTIKVDKKLPSVRASSVRLNSFFENHDAALVFTSKSGAVTAVEINEGAATSRTPACPLWLELDEESMPVSLADGTQNKRYSGRLSLLAYVEGYSRPVAVSVSVSASSTKPTLKLSASSVTVYGSAVRSSGAALSLLSSNRKTPYSALDVTELRLADISGLSERDRRTYAATESYMIEAFDAATGSFKLSAADLSAVAGRVLLEAVIGGRESQTIRLPLTVRTHTRAPSIKLSKSSVSLNHSLGGGNDPVEITVRPTPLDYNMGQLDIKVYDSRGKTELTDAGLLDIVQDGDRLVVRTADAAAGATYKVVIALKGSAGAKPVTLTVKTLSQARASSYAVTPTLTAKGTLDTSRMASSYVTLTAKYRNYNGLGDAAESFTVTATNSRTRIAQDVTSSFTVAGGDGTYILRLKEGEKPDPLLKYTVTLTSDIGGQTFTSKAARITLRQGTARLTQSVRTVTLYKNDRLDEALIKLSAADASLMPIERVEIRGAATSAFDLTPMGGGEYAIGFIDDIVSSATRSGTVRLDVYLEGNNGAKPNATVNVSVKVSSLTAPKITLAGTWSVERGGYVYSFTFSRSSVTFKDGPAGARPSSINGTYDAGRKTVTVNIKPRGGTATSFEFEAVDRDFNKGLIFIGSSSEGYGELLQGLRLEKQ